MQLLMLRGLQMVKVLFFFFFLHLCLGVAFISCLTNQINPKQKPDVTRHLLTRGQEMPT